jgi:hypothetical protein
LQRWRDVADRWPISSCEICSLRRVPRHYRDTRIAQRNDIVLAPGILQNRAFAKPAPAGHTGEGHQLAGRRNAAHFHQPVDDAEPGVDRFVFVGNVAACGDGTFLGIHEDALELRRGQPLGPDRAAERAASICMAWRKRDCRPGDNYIRPVPLHCQPAVAVALHRGGRRVS